MSKLLLYRETGFRHTMTFNRQLDDGRLEAVDCTGCTVRAEVRVTPNSEAEPLVILTTDVAPADLASGLAWSSITEGQLQIVIGEDDSKDLDLFPRVLSTPWTRPYYCDVIVRDSDGVPKFDPVRIDLWLKETATVT